MFVSLFLSTSYFPTFLLNTPLRLRNSFSRSKRAVYYGLMVRQVGVKYKTSRNLFLCEITARAQR